MLTLKYDLGCVVLKSMGQSDVPESDLLEVGLRWDSRTNEWRAPGHCYKDIVLKFHQHPTLKINDEAKAYEKLSLALQKPIVPRQHQALALSAWRQAGARGVVCLPTGAGKTMLAVMAIAELNRPALIMVPTIDLLLQWQKVLSTYFALPIGTLGGGSKDLQAITVSTYDSAVLMVESLGNKFGLIIFDECHHLPAPQYQNIALAAIAPFRLGLSATLERADGKEQQIYELVGPVAYRAEIGEMVDNVLAPYDVVSVGVQLSPEEKEQYDQARKQYVDFLRRQGIDFGAPGGWMEFVFRCSRSEEGRHAMRAYRLQKKIAQYAAAKFYELWRILMRHKNDPTIIFTDDNAFAYQIGRDFVLPVITHQTKLKERKFFLESFRERKLLALVSAKVLNEGVDVPDARVAVIMSGSAGVREHVQRLGRILRHQPGKRAVLYELVSERTSEQFVHKRRRMHHAYQEPPPLSP